MLEADANVVQKIADLAAPISFIVKDLHDSAYHHDVGDEAKISTVARHCLLSEVETLQLVQYLHRHCVTTREWERKA